MLIELLLLLSNLSSNNLRWIILSKRGILVVIRLLAVLCLDGLHDQTEVHTGLTWLPLPLINGGLIVGPLELS